MTYKMSLSETGIKAKTDDQKDKVITEPYISLQMLPTLYNTGYYMGQATHFRFSTCWRCCSLFCFFTAQPTLSGEN